MNTTSLNQIELFSKDGRICLRVRIQPRASRNEIVGPHGNALKIRLSAPPLDNRANRLLQEFLAEILSVGKDRITILSGVRSRTKTVGILGVSASELLNRLAQYLV